MTRRRGRPSGSSTDNYIIGLMCGLLYELGPMSARDLARLVIKLGQVPRGGSETSRVERLARKIMAGDFRIDTKEWRDGIMMYKWMRSQLSPSSGPPLMERFDTSECASIADAIRLRKPK
jgi:hypothetical protein